MCAKEVQERSSFWENSKVVPIINLLISRYASILWYSDSKYLDIQVPNRASLDDLVRPRTQTKGNALQYSPILYPLSVLIPGI